MKQNKEMIEWFNNYFDNCYYVRHNDYPESIFMFYDINYTRQLKLAKLEGKNIEKTDITGVCVFEQDWKNKWFGCNYRLIYSYFRDNYSFNFTDFKSFITDRLEEYSKMSVLTPYNHLHAVAVGLEEYSKMSVLTPGYHLWNEERRLEEYSKMSVLTPMEHQVSTGQVLEEYSKMSVLTPNPYISFKGKTLEEYSKMSVLTPTPLTRIRFALLEEYNNLEP